MRPEPPPPQHTCSKSQELTSTWLVTADLHLITDGSPLLRQHCAPPLLLLLVLVLVQVLQPSLRAGALLLLLLLLQRRQWTAGQGQCRQGRTRQW